MNIQAIPSEKYLILHITDILNDSKFLAISKTIYSMCNNSNRGFFGDSSSKNFMHDYMFLSGVFSSIKSILLEHTNKELTLTGFHIHLNRVPPELDWHIHKKEYVLDPINFSKSPNAHVAVFYLHHEWDRKFSGNLLVGEDRNNPIAKFNCDPNTCVIHSADLAHGVDWLNTNSFSKRIVMYSHWVDI